MKNRLCPIFTAFFVPDKGVHYNSGSVYFKREVTVKNSKDMMSFKDATDRYLDRHFTKTGVHVIPAIHFYEDKTNAGENLQSKRKNNRSWKFGREHKTCSTSSCSGQQIHDGRRAEGLDMADDKMKTNPKTSLELQIKTTSISGGCTKEHHVFPRSSKTEEIPEQGNKSAKHGLRKAIKLSSACKDEMALSEEEQKEKNSRSFLKQLSLRNDAFVKDLDTKANKDEIIIRRQAIRAVRDVSEALERWATTRKLNGFILKDFKFQNYLKALFSKPNRQVTKSEGDHDIIGIFESIGLVFIQVKSSSKDTVEKAIGSFCSQARKAFEQVFKDKLVSLECNRDLPFYNLKTPMYGFVAFPFMEDDVIRKINLCPHHKRYIIYGRNGGNLERLLDAIIPKNESFTHSQYWHLSSRYAGLASKVEFRTLSEAIDHTDNLLSGTCTTKFLTPQQITFMHSTNRLQGISGDYGTGKSMLLATKAKSLTNKNSSSSVTIVICSDISNWLNLHTGRPNKMVAQMKTMLKNVRNIHILTFDELVQRVRATNKPVPKFIPVNDQLFQEAVMSFIFHQESQVNHLLLDELPVKLLIKFPNLLPFIAEELHETAQLCVAIATQSYRVLNSQEDNPEWVNQYLPASFDSIYLRQIMRAPGNLIKMVKKIESITGRGHGQFSECGHAVDGPIPLFFRVPPCHCKDNGKSPLGCACIKRRFTATMRALDEKIQFNRCNRVAILVFLYVKCSVYIELFHLLNDVLKSFDVALQWCTSWQPEMTNSSKPQKLNYTLETSDHLKANKEQVSVSVKAVEQQEGFCSLKESDQHRGRTRKLKTADLQRGETISLFGTSQQRQNTCSIKEADQPQDQKGVCSFTVVDQRTYIGCENEVVICVDPFSMHQWCPRGFDSLVLTRCLSQYIHVGWVKEEAKRSWEVDLDAEFRVVEKSDRGEDMIKRMKERTEEAKKSDGSCLDVLISERLIKECKFLYKEDETSLKEQNG